MNVLCTLKTYQPLDEGSYICNQSDAPLEVRSHGCGAMGEVELVYKDCRFCVSARELTAAIEKCS